jgi:hypothetical protein
MRRISWTDQRISSVEEVCRPRLSFLGRRDVGVMSDGGGHGEGQHDQGDVAMPAVPGAGFVVVEAELVLGGLEAVLD